MEFLDELNKRIADKTKAIEQWIEVHSKNVLIPLYTSVDIRVSRHKIAPVDTNIYPAGFNNLSNLYRERTAKLFKHYFLKKYPKVRKILIIPELNTRNLYYWENIHVLKSLLEGVGFTVEAGIVSDELQIDELSFKTISGIEIQAYRVFKEGYRAQTLNYVPDLILINNDFSSNCPKTLKDILQPVEPPVEIGWHTRRKNIHFEFYNKLANELSGILEIDPWVISIETNSEEGVDFDNARDRERAAQKVDLMLSILRDEYKNRDIDEDPYLFVKSNSGTYGMAVLNVWSGDDLRNLNSQDRKRMKVSKGGEPVRDVVIQEGVPTTLKVRSNISAEPVLYLVSAKVAGAFIRLNKSRDEFENLNTKGMEFDDISNEKEIDHDEMELDTNLPLTYQLIARTASIAAGYEIERILKEGGCKDETT